MEKIIVDKVSPNEVTLIFGWVKISFSIVNGQLKMTSKCNRFAGSNSISLPKNIFGEMTRRAAKILKDQQNKNYQWFVKPLDAATNEAIYNGLRSLGSSAADEMRRIIDTEGVFHLVWEANYAFVSFLEKSAKSKALKFQIFNRPGENTRARPWPFPRRRPATKKPTPKKAA